MTAREALFNYKGKTGLIPVCRIEMLGGLRVVQADRIMTRFQTQKTGALLAYCALHPNRSFARESIAELLWPGGNSTAIRNRLNQAVSSLRRQLHPPGSVPGAVLVADHYTVRVNPEAITTDVAEFSELIRESAEAHDDAEAANLRRHALDIYKGDFLEGYQEEWAGPERIRLRDQYLEAASWLIKYYAANEQVDLAIDLASRRLTFDSHSEVYHRTLIRLYLKAGRAKSALAHAEQFERTLATAGLPISAKLSELTAMAKQASGVTGSSPKPIPMPMPLPAQRSDPPSPPFSAPPIEISSPALPLPRYLARFVDREFETERIGHWLVQDERRIITLTGIGGSGKTRLAVEIAARSVEAYEGRVFFVSFEDESGSADVLDLIAQATILSRAPSERFGEHLPSHLASIGKSLLVLDNLEYLSDRQVNQILEVLQEVPQVQALCTSRQPLGVEGEQILVIDPLPVPAMGDTDLEHIAANPSVSLFIQRAQLVRQDFQLTERTAGSIVEVCRRLDGMPLALELAASWARTLTPGQMLSQIEESIDNLSSRRRDAAPRHSSVGRAIDGSFALLSDEEQNAFQRIAILAGEWDFEDARAVCPDKDLRPILQALEDRALIQTRDNGREVVYCMRELLRSYAAARTPASLAEELSELHASHFAAEARSLRDASLTQLLTVFGNHRLNMQRALDWVIEQHGGPQTLDFAIVYFTFAEFAGFHHDAMRTLERIERALAPSDRTSLDYGVLQAIHARMLDALGDSEKADAACAKAEAILASQYDATLEFEIACRQSARCHRTGRYEEAVEIVERLSTEKVDMVPQRLRSRLHLIKGNALSELERLEEAVQAYEKSLDMSARLNDEARVSAARGNLGNAYRLLGKFETAAVLLNQTLEMQHDMKAYGRLADVHFMLGQLAVDRGDPQEALREFSSVDSLLIGDVLLRMECVLWTGYALNRLNQCELAAKLFGFAETFARQHGLTFGRLEAQKYSEETEACITQLGVTKFESLRETGAHSDFEALRSQVSRIASSPKESV